MVASVEDTVDGYLKDASVNQVVLINISFKPTKLNTSGCDVQTVYTIVNYIQTLSRLAKGRP